MVTPLTYGSTSGVSFSGLATGLNTSQIIQALVTVESNAIKQPLLDKKSVYQNKLSILSSLESKLQTLKTKAEAIDTTAEFLAYTVSSTDSKVVTATADGSAVLAPHKVTVDRLAQAEVESHSPAVAIPSSTSTVGTGTFSVTYAGTQTDFTIASGDDTLSGIATKINAAAIGVTASVVNTGSPASPAYKLVLTGKDTGASNTISVSHTLSGGSFSLGAFSTSTAAQDSQFDVDGILDIQRATNSITDVIPGVTLSLLSVSATEQTLTVAQDTATVKKKINDFVTAYNDVANLIKQQKTFVQGQPAPVLFGDLAIRLADQKMSSIIAGVQNSSSTTAANLAKIGITTDVKTGTLLVDDTKLQTALDANLADVGKLFATGLTGGGVAVQFKSWLDDFLSTADGVIKAEQDGFNDTIKGIDAQVVKADAKLTKLQDSLTQKFANLEALIGGLQSQLSYLGSVSFGLPQ